MPHRHNQRQRMRVQFAEKVQMHIFEHSEDSKGKSVVVDREELWYTPAEYDRMKLAVRESILEVWRKQRAIADVPVNYSAAAGIEDKNGDSPSPAQAQAQAETEAEAQAGAELQGVLSDCVGIEHLLTRASMLEVRACRARCVRGVLEEQARQTMDADQSVSTSSRLRWNTIALSSLTQTRRTTMRARMLGKLHREVVLNGGR